MRCSGAADIQAFKATMRRETILINRTLFVYIFKAVQVGLYALHYMWTVLCAE